MSRAGNCKPERAVCWLAWSLLVVGGAFADWPHIRTAPPLRVHADFPLNRLDPLLVELNQHRADLYSRLQLPNVSEPIDVYLFSDREVYTRYLKLHFRQVEPRRAMFIKANSPGNVFAYSSSELETDLRHECTHAYLHAQLPVVPLWLDEGLAEYFEVPATSRATDHPHMQATRRGLLWNRPPSLRRLEQLTDLSQMGAREYQESWAWVHFLLHGPPSARRALTEFVRDTRAHRMLRPISERLAEGMSDPNQEFTRHFYRWQR